MSVCRGLQWWVCTVEAFGWHVLGWLGSVRWCGLTPLLRAFMSPVVSVRVESVQATQHTGEQSGCPRGRLITRKGGLMESLQEDEGQHSRQHFPRCKWRFVSKDLTDHWLPSEVCWFGECIVTCVLSQDRTKY